MLGTNDLKARFHVTAPDIADGLTRYRNALRSAGLYGPEPKVLLVSPIEMDPSYHQHEVFSTMFGPDADVRSKGFAEAYRKAAATLGWEYLDAAGVAKASHLDGLHLDAEGHRRLGLALASKVRGILE